METENLPLKIRKVLIPNTGEYAHFVHRDLMKSRSMRTSIKPRATWPSVKLPINWYGNINFPMYGNNQFGDCGAAMAAHGDNTFTGNVGPASMFNLNDLVAQYEQYSGGDNGLSEQDVVALWKNGIAGNKSAVIYDALDLNPTQADVAHSAIDNFFGLCLGLSLPDAWINSFVPGGTTVWDAPAVPNENNGHFVWINGVDAQGRYHVETWGSSVWLTQAGFDLCEPSIFCVFSPRFFGANGLDPTGANYALKSALWAFVGGSVIVQPGPVPTPTPVPPAPPQPVPVPPVPSQITTVADMVATLGLFDQRSPVAYQGPLRLRYPVVRLERETVVIAGGSGE